MFRKLQISDDLRSGGQEIRPGAVFSCHGPGMRPVSGLAGPRPCAKTWNHGIRPVRRPPRGRVTRHDSGRRHGRAASDNLGPEARQGTELSGAARGRAGFGADMPTSARQCHPSWISPGIRTGSPPDPRAGALSQGKSCRRQLDRKCLAQGRLNLGARGERQPSGEAGRRERSVAEVLRKTWLHPSRGKPATEVPLLLQARAWRQVRGRRESVMRPDISRQGRIGRWKAQRRKRDGHPRAPAIYAP